MAKNNKIIKNNKNKKTQFRQSIKNKDGDILWKVVVITKN